MTNIFTYLESKFCKPRFNLIKTVYFNFRVLPFTQAIRIPILLYGKWNFKNLSGDVEIRSGKIMSGMFRFGYDYAKYSRSLESSINFCKNGVLCIYDGVKLCQGTQITIYPNAVLTLHQNCLLGDGVNVICSSKITIGKRCDITWGCQIMDFNSHYISSNGLIHSITKPIEFGEFCWICNNSTIMPGTILPARIIVTSHSLLNKNYIDEGVPEHSLIGGIPAKLIKKDVYRIYGKDNEKLLKNYFKSNHEIKSILEKEFLEFGKTEDL